jgi:hypothetical protein
MPTRIRVKSGGGKHKDKLGEIINDKHLPKGKVAFTVKMDNGEHVEFAFHEIHILEEKE